MGSTIGRGIPVHEYEEPLIIDGLNRWVQGYFKAMGKFGLQPLVMQEPTLDTEKWLDQAFAFFSEMTAVVVQDADSGLILKKHLERRGMRIPEDISVVCTNQSGFDISNKDSFFDVVELPWEKIGQKAVGLLLGLLGQGDAGELVSSQFSPEGIVECGTVASISQSL